MIRDVVKIGIDAFNCVTGRFKGTVWTSMRAIHLNLPICADIVEVRETGTNE